MTNITVVLMEDEGKMKVTGLETEMIQAIHAPDEARKSTSQPTQDMKEGIFDSF